MAELTPIPAEHRHLYHEALRAGLAEAERRELDLDALPFAAFHRALYRPLLDAHEAEVRAKVAEEIAKAIEADSANDASETPDWYAAMNHAADIARQHAYAPAETAAAGREGTPASDSVQDDPKPAETLSGHSGPQEAQG